MEKKNSESYIDILSGLFGTLYHLVEPYLIPAGIALGVIVGLYLLTTRVIIHKFIVWKEAHGYTTGDIITAPIRYPWKLFRERVLRKPPVVVHRVTQSRTLLGIKEQLMMHDSIREALAPKKTDEHTWIVERGTYTKNIYEGSMWEGSSKIIGTKEVPKKHYYDFSAWLSPYSETVQFFIDKKKGGNYDTKTHRYLPRKHVATIANRLTVREPFPSEARGYKYHPGKGEIFVIEIDCTHATPKEVRSALGNSLETTLWDTGKYKLKDLDPDHRSKIKFLVTAPGIKDVLHSSNMPTGTEFSEAHPMPRDMHNIPFAITEKGDVWSLARIHTLFLGQTGAGKSSLVNTLCAQLAPAMLEGTAKLYAIDPKPKGEIEKYWSTVKDFYTDFALSNELDKWIEIIETVAKPLTGGAKTNRVQIKSQEEIDSGEAEKRIKATEWKPTKETPLTILLIDELPSLLNRLKTERKAEFERVVSLLNIILYMGRAGGILLFAGTQSMADKDIGVIARDQFPNRVALRQASQYFNDLILGEGATKNGYDSTAFPEKDPEFKGRAYARGEEGSPIQIRFPYYTTQEILDIAKPVLPLKAKEEEPEAAAETTEPAADSIISDEERDLLEASLATPDY